MSESNRGERSEALTEQGDDSSAGQQAPDGTKSALNRSGEPDTSVVHQPPSQSPASENQGEAQTEQPEPHVLSDLVAQHEMADASIMMGWAAVGTLVITAIGTFFLAWQVKLTREAVKDTGDATQAMLKGNKISAASASAMISKERGRLRFPTGEHFAVRNSGPQEIKWGKQPPDPLALNAKNEGLTECVLKSLCYRISETNVYNAPTESLSLTRTIIPADKKEWLEEVPETILDGHDRGFFSGYICYQGIAKIRYLAHFCFEFWRDDLGTIHLKWTECENLPPDT